MGELTPVLEAYTLLSIAIMLLAAKLSGLVERFGQPTVLGELIMGVILGTSSSWASVSMIRSKKI
jgi:Sodium/hydrogen exchanger family.